MEKDFESVMDKLRKLQRLAERGERGEARNARAAIERLCAKYGIRLEELAEEQTKKYRFEVGQNGTIRNLFLQCYCKVMNVEKVSYWEEGKANVIIELTALQYAELSSLWDWHKEHFKRELEETREALFIAYCQKHKIYPETSTESESQPHELTAKEKARLLRAMLMQDGLSDERYQKQLESK